MNLQAPPASTNFAPAVGSYGFGDLGTPARRNDADTSVFASTLVVDIDGAGAVFHAADLSHGGLPSVIGLSLGTTPGFTLLGTQIPLNADPLLLTVLQIPNFVAPLPAEGYRSMTMIIPSAASGLTSFAAHFVIDVSSSLIPSVSSPVQVVFP